MVQEYGEIDLARLLAKHETARRQAPGATGSESGIDENFIRLYWQQMLQVREQGVECEPTSSAVLPGLTCAWALVQQPWQGHDRWAACKVGD